MADGGRSGRSDLLAKDDAGRGMPYDKRFTWLSRRLLAPAEEFPSSSCRAEDVLPLGRFELRRTVIEEGMCSPRAEPALGDPVGVLPGAGSFDLAE